MDRVAAGDHLPNPPLFEPAKHANDGTDHRLGSSVSLPVRTLDTTFYNFNCKREYLVFQEVNRHCYRAQFAANAR